MRPNQRYKDPAKNAFAKSNLFYSSSPFIGIQDPTVLGFKIFFEFDQITSPLLYGLNGDPSEAPLNTAMGFLASIKDSQRMYYLQKFIYLLSGINSQTPWYFQTLGGLKDAWIHDYAKPYIGDDKKLEIECAESIDLRVTALMDLYRKACYDWKNRRQVIPENLRKFKMSIYVYEARWIQNSMAIATVPKQPLGPQYGYGAGPLGEAAKKNAELVSRLIGKDETINDPNTNQVNILEGVPMSTTRNLFHFSFCEFNMDEPGHFEGLSNAEPAEAFKHKLIVRYYDVEEENMYNYWLGQDPVSDAFVATLDQIALDDPQIEEPQPGEPQLRDRVPGVAQVTGAIDRAKSVAADLQALAAEGKEKWAKLLKDKVVDGQLGYETGNEIENRIARRILREAEARLTGLFLGNVYGLSPATLTGAAGVQTIASRLYNSIEDAGRSLLNDRESEINQNVFSDSIISSGGSEASGNAFDDVIPRPTGGSDASGNIYE